MSVAIASPEAESHQPFQCLVCQTRFTRHENLKRHAALHTGSQEKPSFPCDFCCTTFSRRDLRNRHIQRKHPEQEERRASKRRRRNLVAATAGTSSDGRSDLEVPPSSIAAGGYGSLPPQWDDELSLSSSSGAWHPELVGEQLGVQLHDDYQEHHLGTIDFSLVGHAVTGQDADEQIIDAATSFRTLGVLDGGLSLPAGCQNSSATPFRASSSPDCHADSTVFSQSLPDGLSPRDLPYVQDEWYPTASQVAQGIDLYFAHVSHFVPFLHLPTFDPTQSADSLVISMLCIAYQHGEDPDAGNELGSGDDLSQHCFHRARVLVASVEEKEDDIAHNIAMVQTYLLLEICAMMYLCGKDSAYGLKLHSKMIALARSSRLTQPLPSVTAAPENLESLWKEFIKAESHKRTLLAIHQIDALWYQMLSIPRSLSHLEIKHELPCPEDRWGASSAAEWAHRQLLKGHAMPPLQYADAIRRFLSCDAAIGSMPPFDPYGAINITQFLLSSAREVSGWSTMTGRLSLERLETLKTSLLALAPFVHPEDDDSICSPGAASVEARATWEMAMIELRIWSLTHTGGVVQGSVDEALRQLTDIACSSGLSYGAETAQATQPHIDWFLRYLDQEPKPKSESPWVTLFAYGAFLIAWQLVRAGIPGAMQAVGVQDGDVDGAMSWVRKVFQQRERWRLGKVIIKCFEVLGK